MRICYERKCLPARLFGNNSTPPREQLTLKNHVFPQKTADHLFENPENLQNPAEDVLEQLADCQNPPENQHLFRKGKPLAHRNRGKNPKQAVPFRDQSSSRPKTTRRPNRQMCRTDESTTKILWPRPKAQDLEPPNVKNPPIDNQKDDVNRQNMHKSNTDNQKTEHRPNLEKPPIDNQRPEIQNPISKI
jgi:hypothetical protein